MEKFKGIVYGWWADISGSVAAMLCWFTKDHCEYLTTLTALTIGVFTLFFITIPKSIPNIKKFVGWIKGDK
jgi:hypothetical protein